MRYLLTALVEKSLVDYEARGGEARYRLLETVRQYARDRLAESSQTDEWRGRHRDYFLVLGERAEAARNSPFQPLQTLWMERLEVEHDNIRTALRFSSEFQVPGSGSSVPAAETGLRLCGALWQFWAFRGYLEEGQYWCQQALEKSGTESPRLRARVQIGMAFLAQNRADYVAMSRASRESLALSRATQDEETTALSLALLGLSVLQEDRAMARKQVREGLCIARRIGARWIANFALHVLGHLSLTEGQVNRAALLITESLSLARECGDDMGIAYNLVQLARVDMAKQRTEDAAARFREALLLFAVRKERRGIAICLERLACSATECGEFLRGCHLFAVSDVLRVKIGATRDAHEEANFDSAIRAVQSTLGEEAFATAWAEGRAMTLDQAIALAREHEPGGEESPALQQEAYSRIG